MTTALATNALTTLAETKEFVKEQTTDNDSIIRLLINAASDRIETFLNRKLIKTVYTEFKDGHRNNRYLLNNWPVNSITDIFVDSQRAFAAGTALDSGNFAIDFDEKGEGIGIVRFDGIFPAATRNVKIVYDAGYLDPATSELDLPNEIRLACVYMVQYYFKRQGNEDIVQASKSKGDETVGLNNDMPPFVQNLLKDHVRLEFLGNETATRNQ